MSILFLMYYNIVIAGIAALSLPLLILISRHFARLIKKRQKELLDGYADFETFSLESISGMKFIKNFIREDFFKKRLLSKYTATMETGQLLGKATIGYDLFISTLGSAFSVIAIAVGAYYVMVGNLEVGELFAIMTISTTISIISVVVRIQESLVSLDRLQDIVDVSEEENTTVDNDMVHLNSKSGDSTLILRNVSFNYPGKLPLLDEINLAARTGEIITLFGDIGEGKSTLLYLIQRFYSAKKGLITFDGININDYPINSWRKNLGIVSQSTKIFMGSVAENITLFKSNVSRDLNRTLSELGLSCFLNEGPLNLLNSLNENGANLSGGQIQLIGFARALYSNAPILILDEPTSSMDKQNEFLMMEILNKIKRDKIIIMITHKPELAKKTDKIHVLQNGRIQTAGSHAELIESVNSYSKAFQNLFE